MTLQQLRHFLAVAERGHLTRAAKALNMTQSAVSASISGLESQYGIKLFNRVGRGIELTYSGEALLTSARGVLAQAETTELLLEDLALEMRGRLRVYASQTVANYWLPAHLMALHTKHPEIKTSLTVGNTAQVADAVMQGEADLGFVEGDVLYDNLRRKVVARDEMVLVLANCNSLAGLSTFCADDYKRFTWILREQGSGTRSEFEAHLKNMGLVIDDLEIAMELPSNEAILSAVSTGQCVSMLSQRAVDSSAGGNDIRIRQVNWVEKPKRSFAVLTHPERHRTRAVAALLRQLKVND